MTDFKAWIPPAGAVVDPPCHRRTLVLGMYSDGSQDDEPKPAGDLNWSSFGDGPSVVAYAIAEEYKPAPKVAREWWATVTSSGYVVGAWDTRRVAEGACGPNSTHEVIHVREVLEGREVVADGDAMAYLMRIAHIATTLDEARSLARQAIARVSP